eukprot:Platyproteum_vivax@DN4324_c0_g1_i2.p1
MEMQDKYENENTLSIPDGSTAVQSTETLYDHNCVYSESSDSKCYDYDNESCGEYVRLKDVLSSGRIYRAESFFENTKVPLTLKFTKIPYWDEICSQKPVGRQAVGRAIVVKEEKIEPIDRGDDSDSPLLRFQQIPPLHPELDPYLFTSN